MWKKGEKGSDVRELQKALQYLGYALPRWGADGWLGDETFGAVTAWAMDRGHDVPNDGFDALEDDLVAEIMKQLIAMQANGFTGFPLIVDVRKEAWEGAKKGINPIQRIDTICLHQMAVKDSDNQGWERWRKLPIHWVITEGVNSKAFLLHDLNVKTWHGHNWNGRSVGFEFEGYFSGIGTDEKYFWKPASRPNRKPMTPTPEQLAAGKEAVRYTVEEIERMGGQIKYIAAHRQSYGRKESDPGELIWKGIALPMIEELNLQEAPTLKAGSPIPEAWNPANVGVPYRK